MHIGERIFYVMKMRHVSVSQLASAIFCNRKNVYKILKKRDINTDLLFRISIVLQYNFFADIAREISICYQNGDTLRNGDK